jgi:dihydroneopterin aldolase
MASGVLYIKGLTFRAYHGVYSWEQKSGANFTVDLRMEVDLPLDGYKDNLDDTVDYEKVYKVVAALMQQPHALIETLAQEMAGQCLQSFSKIQAIQVTIRKHNPPIGGSCKETAFEYSLKRA